MDLNSLVIVAALFVAVYAVIPRVRRLEITIRIGRLGWFIVVVSALMVLYLQYHKTLELLDFVPKLTLEQWSLSSSKASFIVFLIGSLALYLRLKVQKLSRSNIIQFKEYVFELSREQKYHELFSLVESNINKLARIYHANYLLSKFKKRLESYSKPKSDLHAVLNQLTEQDLLQKRRSKPATTANQQLAALLSSMLPSYEKHSEAAKEVVHELLSNKRTVHSITEMRPYFAIRLINENFEENNEFVDLFFQHLMENKNSLLYRELRNNQNLSNRCNYLLPPRNKLIHFLFSECRIAREHAVYKPVGECVISYLDRLYIQKYADPYNDPMGDYHEEGRWKSELFIGVRFFDVMVSSALYQNIKWNMWLYYYTYFVDRIIRNLSPNEKLVDEHSKWPTKYHYVISEIVSVLCNWIESVDHISIKQDNVALESMSPINEEGNIPKSSMLALAQIIRDVLLCDKLSFSFKVYIMDMVYRVYFYLRMFDATRLYATALMNCLRTADSKIGKDSSNYSKLLFDTFLKFESFKYGAELQKELHGILEDDFLHSRKL